MSLRNLDATLVPRVAAALRALLDRVSSARTLVGRAIAGRAIAGRALAGGALVEPSRNGPLRRLDDRFATTGPLALLRDVPQLGVLVVAAVFLTGAGVALARNSSSSVEQRQRVQAEQALPLSLGVPVGADVDATLGAARERAVELSRRNPDGTFVALVSLTKELTAEQTGLLVAAPGLQVRRIYLRAPDSGRLPEVLSVETSGDVVVGLDAVFAETARRKAEEQREFLSLARSIVATGTEEQTFKVFYEDAARTAGLEAAAYRTACSCVLALVVEGTARELAELLALPSVRGVELAPRNTTLPSLTINPLPVEVTGVRPEPELPRGPSS